MAKQLDFTKYKTLQQFFRAKSRWVKGKSISKDGTACCLIGAISSIYPNSVFSTLALLNRTIKQLYSGHKYRCISEFNDHPRTTIEDIRRVCKEAGV